MRDWISRNTPLYIGLPLDPLIVGLLAALSYGALLIVFYCLKS